MGRRQLNWVVVYVEEDTGKDFGPFGPGKIRGVGRFEVLFSATVFSPRMNRYFFHRDEYEKFYNCSQHTPEKWHSFGRVNIGIAATYTCIGLMFEILYFPCLYVMASPKFLRLSCYKIMYYLGVIDVLCIVINSLISGYLSYKGAVFCDYPDLMYIAGGISTGLWCSACMACMLLALNRLFDLLKPNWMETLFGGNKTYIWLLAPVAYGFLFIWREPPLVYSSYHNAAFFDPFTATDKADAELYTSWAHTINNITVIIVLCSAYTSLCVYILIRGRLANTGASSSNRHGLSTMQRQIIAQASMICGLILIAATVYVRMQFFETPGWMIVVGQITWQFSHGGAVFIYLFLNRSMRREIVKTFFSSGICGSKTSNNVSVTTTTKLNNSKPMFSNSHSNNEGEDESTRY
ncbi:hypothetical protein M3Y97_00753900 [Aphelenchoides bicaudatus]|nr:hypothetical protein M3Y97_00753900 [Aphelenchoides bicaudatus]